MKLPDILKKDLTKKELDLLPRSFDVIGSILLFIDFPKELEKKEKIIGKRIIENYKQIETVAKKTGKYSGKFRTPKIKIISGKKTKTALHKESHCLFKLNIETCYFSARLSNERLRIASLVKPNESILVMFSGIAIYPIIIAKNSKPKEIYAVEINPHAHKFAEENINLNKVKNIKPFNIDVKKFKINKKFSRILMPLPKTSSLFLQDAKKYSKKGTIVHFYCFAREEEIEKYKQEIKSHFKKVKFLKVIKAGQSSPSEYRYCIDFQVL